MEIITNNKPRQLTYGYELSEREKVEFDYINPDDFDSHDFIRYKGNVYDPDEFMRIDKCIAPHPQREGWENWDGYMSDTFFSGILVKYVDSYSVIMATYYA